MELPIEVRQAIEAEASGYPMKKLAETAKVLSDKYCGEREPGKSIVSQKIDAAAYAAVRMPATYGAVCAALNMAKLPQQPRTLLDVGAGTGAGTLAAVQRYPLTKAFLLEREPVMRALGERLLKASEEAAACAPEYLPCDLTRGLGGKHADLVLAAYVLNELAPAARERLLEELWHASVQTLVLVEPGTPAGHRILLQARKQLLGLGARVCAPCPHEKTCPKKGDDWCSFSCRVARSRLHKTLKGADVPYEDEKFSVLIVTRWEPERAENRVLRHPVIAPGHIQLNVCGADGIRTLSCTKKDGLLFKTARKADCGDAVPNAVLSGRTEETE